MTWEERYYKAKELVEELRQQKPYEVQCLRCSKDFNIHQHGDVYKDEDCMCVVTITNSSRSRFYLCGDCKEWFEHGGGSNWRKKE